jgi:peptidyl-prolyl cis-trans isomerase D
MAKSRGTQSPTKKHLARIERERLQQRYLIITSIVVVVLVLILISYGYIQSNILQPRQAVASIESEEIIANDFAARTRFERSNMVQQALSYVDTLSFIGEEQSDLRLNIISNIQQIQLQLDPNTFGLDVLNTMIDDVLVRQEAIQRGITVTEEDIDLEIQRQFGYTPDGPLPTATSFPTALPTSTLSPQQLALVTPVPTATDFPTATPDPSATSTQIPSPTPTLAPSLTPTPYTEAAFSENYRTTLQQFEDELNVTEADIRALIQAQLYRQKLLEQFAAEIPLVREQVWARHILVADQETAQQVLDQLNSGTDWNQLALEYSLDESNKAQGGDLGWFGTGMMVPEFEKAAFSTPVGETSQPIQTQFGYHIIQVLGKEDRSISISDYQQAAQQEFQTWIDNRRQEANIEIFDTWTEVVPSEPSIPDYVLDGLQ